MTAAGKATIELVAWLRAELAAGLQRERKLAAEIEDIRRDREFWKKVNDENLRLFISRVAEVEASRDQAREDLAKACALLNGESVELPLEISGVRYVGQVKP